MDSTESATAGGAYCACVSGTYRDHDGVCQSCPHGSYCAQETPTPCPPNSNSSAGAALITQCVCGSGFYPSLGASTDWCLPLPTGARCALGAGMGANCECADGWTAVPTDGVLHCAPPSCEPGYWYPLTAASVAHRADCQPCPADTYLSGYACASCPLVCQPVFLALFFVESLRV